MHSYLIKTLVVLSMLLLLGCSENAAPTIYPNPQYPQSPQIIASSQTITLTAPTWVTQKIRDPNLKDIADAVTVMYHFAPESRPFIDAAATKRIPIQWEHLPDYVGGTYHWPTDEITINDRLRGASLGLISSAVIHELQHAMENYGDSPGECLTNEIASYTIEAIVWMRLRDMFRSPTPDTREQFLDELTAAYQSHALIPLILNMKSYWQDCRLGTCNTLPEGGKE